MIWRRLPLAIVRTRSLLALLAERDALQAERDQGAAAVLALARLRTIAVEIAAREDQFGSEIQELTRQFHLMMATVALIRQRRGLMAKEMGL